MCHCCSLGTRFYTPGLDFMVVVSQAHGSLMGRLYDSRRRCASSKLVTCRWKVLPIFHLCSSNMWAMGNDSSLLFPVSYGHPFLEISLAVPWARAIWACWLVVAPPAWAVTSISLPCSLCVNSMQQDNNSRKHIQKS